MDSLSRICLFFSICFLVFVGLCLLAGIIYYIFHSIKICFSLKNKDLNKKIDEMRVCINTQNQEIIRYKGLYDKVFFENRDLKLELIKLQRKSKKNEK